MERTFFISQLMIQSRNMVRLERLQLDKEMIIQQAGCWVMPIFTKIRN